jgi:hypothetical protein
MANSKALDALHEFIQQPTEANASALVDIPVLHDVLTYEFALISQPNQGLPKDVLAICQWIFEQGTAVLGWLTKNISVLHGSDGGCVEKPWMEVSGSIQFN